MARACRAARTSRAERPTPHAVSERVADEHGQRDAEQQDRAARHAAEPVGALGAVRDVLQHGEVQAERPERAARAHAVVQDHPPLGRDARR